MTNLFDAPIEPVHGEVREIDGVDHYWHQADPTDPFDVSAWVPVVRQIATPNHRPAPSTDETYKIIKAHKAYFQRRTIEAYKALGYECYSVQSTSISGWGESRAVHSHDLYGLFDFEMWKGLETIGVQITSKSNLGAHLTKMCAHVPCSSKDKTWRGTWLRRWLEAGRKAHLIGFHKPGRLWEHEIREVTLDVMDAYEPGRRFKRMAG